MRAIVPEDLPRPARPRAAKYIERACFASARRACDPYHGSPPAEEIAKALWNHDDVTPMVLRSVTSPATTTTSGWASQLAVSAVGDYVSSLAPISAGAKLLDASVRVSLDGINSISFPSRSGVIDPAAVPWVAQGAPIPVGQFALTSVTLGPVHKLAILTAMTREVAEHGSGETVLAQLLRENASLALDASLFSTTAGTADRPPGLLAGVSALTAVGGGDDAAMASDLSDLAAAISDDATGLVFVMHPAQAAAVRLRRGAAFPTDIPIWSSIAVPVATVIAIDPLAVVSSIGAEPEVTSSKEALIHQEATTPLQIATGAQGSGVLATPTRSLFQTDCIAVRLILRVTWALRSPAVAWMQTVSW